MTTKTQTLTQLISDKYNMTNKQLGMVFDVTPRTIYRWRQGTATMTRAKAVATAKAVEELNMPKCNPERLRDKIADYLYREDIRRELQHMPLTRLRILEEEIANKNADIKEIDAIKAEFDYETKGTPIPYTSHPDDYSDILVDWD